MTHPRLHVIFSPSHAGTLRLALQEAGRADQVVCAFDDFAFGPIAGPGLAGRAEWVEAELNYDWAWVIDTAAPVLEASRTAERPPIVWLSRTDAHAYAGYLWWLSEIGQIPCAVIDAPDLRHLHSEQMGALLGSEVALSDAERGRDHAHWRRLQQENSAFRVVEGQDLVSAPIDHFDPLLLSQAVPQWRKAGRIVGEVLGLIHRQGVSQVDTLPLAARLWVLAEAGRLEWRGELGEMQNSEMRLPAEGR